MTEKNRVVVLLALMVLSWQTISAQDDTPSANDAISALPGYNGRIAGDTMISSGATFIFPLFNLDVSKGAESSFRQANMNFGLGLGLDLAYFLTNIFYLGLGISLGGVSDKVEQFLWFFGFDAIAGAEIPIYTGTSLLNPLFIIPLSLRISGLVHRYETLTALNPAIKPQAGIFFVLPDLPNWSIGASIEYQFVFDFPGGDGDRIANQLRAFLGFRFYTY